MLYIRNIVLFCQKSIENGLRRHQVSGLDRKTLISAAIEETLIHRSARATDQYSFSLSLEKFESPLSAEVLGMIFKKCLGMIFKEIWKRLGYGGGGGVNFALHILYYVFGVADHESEVHFPFNQSLPLVRWGSNFSKWDMFSYKPFLGIVPLWKNDQHRILPEPVQ